MFIFKTKLQKQCNIYRIYHAKTTQQLANGLGVTLSMKVETISIIVLIVSYKLFVHDEQTNQLEGIDGNYQRNSF